MSLFTGKTVLIADSHLSGEEEEKRLFFRMLEKIRKDAPERLVFLGDIFELWIALPGYETPLQKEFLSFCKEAKKEFPISFVEGNHEFYVKYNCKKAFTCVHDRILPMGEDALLIHGDTVNKADWKYASLRILIRNCVTSFLLRLLSLTWGVETADRIRLILKPTNKTWKTRFPEEAFAASLEKLPEKKRGKTIFTGHFHSYNHLTVNGTEIHTIPAWDMEKALIGLWDGREKKLEILSLQERGELN